MEKKKLLLVAISVGVFLVLTIGAAILVFTPGNTNLPFETVTSNTNPGTITLVPPSFYQPSTAGSEPQPSSIDAVELVRNPGGVPGLVTSEGVNSQTYETGRGTENAISVTQPSTAAVPSTAPTGRAVNQSTPTASTRPAQTTTAPAQTTTTPATTASRPAQTSTSPTQTTSTPVAAARPAQTTTTPAPTTTTPAPTTTTPAPTTTTPATTASRPSASTPTQTAPTQITPPLVAATGTSTQARIYDDFWVQTGAFSTITSAEWVKETLASKGITSIIENRIIDGRNLFRVRVGPYTSQNEANYWLALIQSMDGFEDSQVRQTQNLR